MQVIVHGGAGGAPDDPEPRQAVVDEAASTGATEETPLDAVEAAVNVLEASPRFNAGTGSAVQSDGTLRTDAGVMTQDRRVGAVCSVEGLEHAVSAARIVLEETPHILVSGEHAARIAEEYGIETGVDLHSERTRERWADLDPPAGGVRAHLDWVDEQFGSRPDEDDETDHDTVGAVAREGDRIAAATSTGGRWMALAGRVGDVPQVGCGFYCAPAGGVSTTGAGEDIARVTLARRVVGHLEAGLSAQEAADRGMAEFGELTGSSAGLIVLDSNGNAGKAYNSDAMQTAVAVE